MTHPVLRATLSLLFVSCLALLGGCVIRQGPGGDAAGGGGATSGGGGGGSSAIVVQNASAQTICYAYISSSADSNWGADRLGSHVISPGESYGMPVAAGSYDIKLEDCNHATLLDRRGVAVTGGGVQLTYN